uniref:Probable inactive purple acid phosphatase 24 n=1 Tax=Nicotiana tabacum TaxID=4097 RepID=A0A1S3YW01_TOBAC|nr:PREDICTED: probable inactive purple acid phosphatase 24 [Nicotiana tabacum]
MRNKFYLLLWLLALNNIVLGDNYEYIRLGRHEHDLSQGEQPLSRVQIHKTVLALRKSASIKVAGSSLLGSTGEDVEWVTINLKNAKPTNDDWIGVFSPAKFKDDEGMTKGKAYNH